MLNEIGATILNSEAVPLDSTCAKRRPVVSILKAAAPYFAIVFGAGFVLGPVRLFWLVPRVGTRTAELLETPIMLIVVIAAASSVVRRLALPAARSSRLSIGLVALGLLLLAEFSLVVWLRGMSLADYLSSRDPVSGTVYYMLLGVFAVTPSIVGRRQ